jgi:hypothetical protein
VQIAENWARLRGRVEAWQPPQKSGESGTLTLAVDHVEDVVSRDGSRHPNLLADTAGTTVQVIVPASTACHVEPQRGATAVIEARRGPSAHRVFAHPERISFTAD